MYTKLTVWHGQNRYRGDTLSQKWVKLYKIATGGYDHNYGAAGKTKGKIYKALVLKILMKYYD